MRTRPGAVWASSTGGQRSGLLRLLGVHVVPGRWGMWCKTRSSSERLLSPPPGRRHRGRATRRAHETHPGALQLPQCSQERSGTGTSGFAVEATARVSRGRCVVGTIPSGASFACESGAIAMSHIMVETCPVLVRASGEQSSGATRQSGVRVRAGRRMDEIESPSHVQDEVPRPELGLLRSSPGPSRRYPVVPGGHRRLGTGRSRRTTTVWPCETPNSPSRLNATVAISPLSSSQSSRHAPPEPVDPRRSVFTSCGSRIRC